MFTLNTDKTVASVLRSSLKSCLKLSQFNREL